MAGGSFECSMPGCQQTFPSRTSLNRHLMAHAPQQEREWNCQRCHWTFPDQLALQKHQIVSGHLEQPANCSKCGEKFASTAQLEAHRRFPSPCSDAYAVSKPTVTTPSAPVGVAPSAGGLRGDAQPPSVSSSSTATEARTAPTNNKLRPTVHVDNAAPSKMSATGHYTIEQLQNLRPKSNIKAEIPAAAENGRTQQDHVSRSVSVASAHPEITFSSEEGVLACHACQKNFNSTAAYKRHFLGCMTGAPSAAPRQASVQQQTTKVVHTEDTSKKQKIAVRESSLDPAPSPLIVQSALAFSNGAKSRVATEHKAGFFGLNPKKHKPASHFQKTSQLQGYGSASALHQRPSTTSRPDGRKEMSTTNKAASSTVNQPKARLQPTAPTQQSASTSTPTGQAHVSSFPCTVAGCINSRPFTSQKALDVHLADAHGIGGKALDLTGKDSWILSQRTRNELQQAGQLSRANGGSYGAPRGGHRGGRAGNGRGGHQGHGASRLPEPPRNVIPAPVPIFEWAPPTPQVSSQMPLNTLPVFHAAPTPHVPMAHHVASVPMASPVPQAGPSSAGGPGAHACPPGPKDLEAHLAQLNEIAPSMIKIDLQDDVLYREDGSIVCGGAKWKRMHLANQATVVADFEPQVHLKKVLWGEFAQSPAAFMEDNTARQYPVEDFMNSPDVQIPRSGLRVVALSCIKVKDGNNLQEIVKIAAVDVATCRILLNHLVCPDPKSTQVTDWNTESTGMRSFHDLEYARCEGYKILKGWQAARAALWKYIDRETILVGYNLRADLDALRMIHGCAVDVAKAVEKAADGPLSQKQLTLEVLCRSLSEVNLTSHTYFGRNALLNAFAIRDLALWCVKKPSELKKWAQAKSLDYQRVMRVFKPAGGLPTPAPSPKKPDSNNADPGGPDTGV